MGADAARAVRRGRAGLRVLQQQRHESRRARWTDGAGCGERETTAAPPAGGEGAGELEELMDVLAIIHGESVRAGVFGDVVRARGHGLEEWSLAWGTQLPRPIDAYGAALVFGGAMHADQDQHHPWLREENLFLQRLLDLHTPVIGICLGAQLLAKAAHAPVFPVEEAEVGWFEVELTDAGADDPILGRLPRTFEAFQWHYYA